MSGHRSARNGPLSADEFSRLPEEDGYRLELVRGRVVREPPPLPEHGRLEVRLGARLHTFVERAGLGVVLSNTGFVVATDPDTVRAPDLAFVAMERIPAQGYTGTYWRTAPDLVIEILSPSNTAPDMQDEVLEYLNAGTRMVWVLDSRRRITTVYRSPDDIRIVAAGEDLDGAAVVPGFRLAPGELFA